jgi:predicted glycosyltransferase
VVVSGPFLSERRQREIAARAQTVGHSVEVTPFTDRFEELLGGAAGVISMAGYNTVVEILSAGVPVLLVPRETPRLEQRLRAERLARVAEVEVCPADRLEPRRIERFVARVLAEGRPMPQAVDLGGVERTAQELSRVLRVDDRAGAKEGGRRRAAIA